MTNPPLSKLEWLRNEAQSSQTLQGLLRAPENDDDASKNGRVALVAFVPRSVKLPNMARAPK